MRFLLMTLILAVVPTAVLADDASVLPAIPAVAPSLAIPIQRHTVIPILVNKDIRVGGAGDARKKRRSSSMFLRT
jgi:hypothetical protein